MKTKIVGSIFVLLMFGFTSLVSASTLSIGRLAVDALGISKTIDYLVTPLSGTIKFQKKTLEGESDELRILIKRTESEGAHTLSNVVFDDSSTSKSGFTVEIEDATLDQDSFAVVKLTLSGSTAGDPISETLILSFNDGLFPLPVKGQIVAYIMGDVSLDNKITSFDAAKILYHSVSYPGFVLTGNALLAGDVTDSGAPTALDASYVLQYNVYKDPGFSSIDGVARVEKPVLAREPIFELGVGKLKEKQLIVPLVISAPGMLAMDFKIWFNSGALKFVEIQKIGAVADMMWQHYVEGDYANFAAAGIDPIDEEEITIPMVFEVIDESRLEEDLVYIETALINEIDVILSGENYSLGGSIPTIYSLSQNYPNPFNPTTTIKYTLPEANFMKLSIYNILGQLVWETSGHQPPGAYEVLWNSRNNGGQLVASGVYIYRLEAGQFSRVRKMVLVR